MSTFKRDVFLGLLPFLFGVELLASIVFLPIALHGNADFRQFYTGGYMLRAGYRHQLYDYDLQTRIGGSPLPAVHPAYEYLLFAPLTLLPYRAAYVGWLLINCGLLLGSIRLLRSEFGGSPWLLAGIVLAFVPVWITLFQGQDSLLLLFLLLLTSRSKDELSAGLWLGLGAFKFHIVVPIALIYLLWRKWRMFAGFCISGGLAALVSVVFVGIGGSLHYVSTASTRAATALHPGAMPSLYGMIIAITGQNIIAVALATLGALGALAWAAHQKPSLAAAILTVPLMSFYFMGHDLTILLIPIAVSGLCLSWVGAVLCLVPGYAYLASIPITLNIGGDLVRKKLIRWFEDRKIWLVEPDETLPRLSPYQDLSAMARRSEDLCLKRTP
jgi:Glycosyltransferase family 87